MEKREKELFDQIFKITTLSNILPFYGYLHEWKRLLTEINRQTEAIWEDNKEALLYLGRDLKQDWSINRLKIDKARRSMIDLISLYVEISDYIYWYNKISYLLKKIEDGETIVIDFHKSNINYLYIQIWNDDSSSDILPSILCKSQTIEKKNFREFSSTDRSNFLKSYKDLKAIVIEKGIQEISWYSAYSSILRINDTNEGIRKTKELDDEINKSWTNVCWTWRPKTLQVETYWKNSNIESIFSLNCLEGINDAQFNVKITQRSDRIIINDIIERFPKAKLNLEIYLNKRSTILTFAGEYFVFAYDNKILNFRCKDYGEDKYVQIQAWDLFESNCKDIVALKINKLEWANTTLAENNNELLIDNDFQSKIKKLTKSSKDLFIIINKKDLSLISDLWDIDDNWKFLKRCTKATIIVKKLIEEDDIWEKIDRFPKNIKYIFEVMDQSHSFLNLLCNYNFVKMIHRLAGRIICRNVEIEVKKLNKKELCQLRKMIEAKETKF